VTNAPTTEQLLLPEGEKRRPVLRESVRDGWALLGLPVATLLVIAFVIPLALILSKSFTDPEFGLHNYARFFTDELYVKVLGNTFGTALLVTVVVIVIAFPYSYLMTIAPNGVRLAMLLIVLLPFWTSLLVRSFALVVFLRDTGIVNQTLLSVDFIDEPLTLMRNTLGVVIGMSQILLPFAVLPIYATMRTIDRNLLKAAEGLGARPAFAFWRVYAPLTLPGVAAGIMLCFVQVLGYYITPTLLGGPRNVMLGELIVQQVSGVLNWGFGAALATILLVSTLLLLLVASRFVNIKSMMGGKW
jgi:putative spermidine/putrescine transport system permease protein